MADTSKFLGKQYEGKDFAELADAPVSALAEHLRQAFGIKTIRDLADRKFVRWAQAITLLST